MYDVKQIPSLRADYSARRQSEGITSEMAFGKMGKISSKMRNFGVANGWGGLHKEGAVDPFPKGVDSIETPGYDPEGCSDRSTYIPVRDCSR